jgi:predicted O-methyltransferase YrrM
VSDHPNLESVANMEQISSAELELLVQNLSQHPAYSVMQELKKISMLHVDVLLLLRILAASGHGGILEIGAYIGGSTIAIALGIREGLSRQFISIEMGGINPAHELATNDIFHDLCKNVQTWGVSDCVNLICDRSDSRPAIEEVHAKMPANGVGLLFVDADGLIERDINNYRGLLRPGSIMVLDDYSMPMTVVRDPNPKKNQLVKDAVNRLTYEGVLEPLGVFGWGTWFGRYRG